MTAFQDLVTSLGALYLQDPLDPAGYVLSGSNVTHIVNLIDGLQLAKGGTNTLQIGAICAQDAFTYNPEATSSTTHVRRTGYSAVASCLQTDFTLFFTADPPATANAFALFSAGGGAGTPPPQLRVFLSRASGPDRIIFTVDKFKVASTGPRVANAVSTTSITHHVYEVVCSNTNWELLIDGSSLGSGTWSNSGTAWGQTLASVQQGANGHATPDSASNTREIGQMVLFPSALSSGDRTAVRDALTYIMCNGHPTAAPDPLFFGGF